MPASQSPIRLAGRASQLALIQTGMVADALAPMPCETIALSTRGDAIQDRSLADAGGKGLFVKALEAALLDGRADAAIHSAKDMETAIAPGTSLAAILPRGDRRDALVSARAKTIADLPQGAKVGTASVRRRALLLAVRPDLEITLLRGNVPTRIEKLKAGDYDAIILAMAGLSRLGITEHVHALDEKDFLPAAGQGAIAVQIRVGDTALAETLAALNHPQTERELAAERALVHALDGSCHTPIAASAHCKAGMIHMTAGLYSPDGSKAFTLDATAPESDAENLGATLGRDLLAQAGGRKFLDRMDIKT